MALEVRPYVPIATQSKFAIVVPEGVTIDVIADAFPEASPGDYIETTDITGSTFVRAWPKAEWDALYTAGS